MGFWKWGKKEEEPKQELRAPQFDFDRFKKLQPHSNDMNNDADNVDALDHSEVSVEAVHFAKESTVLDQEIEETPEIIEGQIKEDTDLVDEEDVVNSTVGGSDELIETEAFEAVEPEAYETTDPMTEIGATADETVDFASEMTETVVITEETVMETVDLQEVEKSESKETVDALDETLAETVDEAEENLTRTSRFNLNTVRIPVVDEPVVYEEESMQPISTYQELGSGVAVMQEDIARESAGDLTETRMMPEVRVSVKEEHSQSNPIQMTKTEKSEEKTQKSPVKQVLSFAGKLLQVLCVILVLAYVFHTFILQRNEVTGTSMEPTLSDKTQILSSRIALSINDLHTADIVILDSKHLSEKVEIGELIKRVVGLPGDTVEIKEGSVFINGEKLEESYLSQETKTMPVDLKYQKVTLGTNQVYVLGDNREKSLDSRYFGPVNESDLIAKCLIRVYPFSQFGIPLNEKIDDKITQ